MIVLINKMDRKDAAPFPDLEVPVPHAARHTPRAAQPHAPQQKMFNDAACAALAQAGDARGDASQHGDSSARHMRCFSTSLAFSQGHQEALLWLAERIPSS